MFYVRIHTIFEGKNVVSLMAVGDVMLGSLPITSGVSSLINKRGPLFPFQHVALKLKKADICFGNLETVLSNTCTKSDQLSLLSGSPNAAKGLAYAGFNIVSLANNHVMDYGKTALLETINVLSRHGIRFAGARENVESASEPVTVEVKDMKIAFLAYSLLPKAMHRMQDTGDTSTILKGIQKAKKRTDVTVVSLHWGYEFVDVPSPKQIQFAHEIIESGADIVLGHHPHVLQGIERYKKGIVAYSLGNFVFDMSPKVTRESVILQCDLSKEGVIDYDVTPIFINDQFQPEILQGENARILLQKIKKLSLQLQDRNLTNLYKEMKEYKDYASSCYSEFLKEYRKRFLMNFYRLPPALLPRIAKYYVRLLVSGGVRMRAQ